MRGGDEESGRRGEWETGRVELWSKRSREEEDRLGIRRRGQWDEDKDTQGA